MPSVLKTVLLPTENKLEDYTTALIDTPGDFGTDDTNISNQVKSANVILVVYDLTDEETVNNMRDFWLPFVKKHNSKVGCG